MAKRADREVSLDEEDEPLIIRRRVNEGTVQQIRREIEGNPIEPIARGGTPQLVMEENVPEALFVRRDASTPYTEVPSTINSGRSTVVYNRSATPALIVPARVSGNSSLAGSPVAAAGGPAVVRMAGDKKALAKGYAAVSLCNVLAKEAIQRALAAAEILDKDHSDQIMAKLRLAGLTNANAASRRMKDIPLKKAISIATKAETWVYQQQAAAAKHAAKEAKRCLSKLSGRGKLSAAEKATRYQARFGVARGTRTDRAVRKLQRRIAKMTGAEQAAP